MLQILTITAPIYLLIAVGYLAVRNGVFAQADMKLLGRLLVMFALPALVFRAITKYPLEQVLNLRYLAIYGGGSVVVFVLGWLFGRRIRGQGAPGSALTGMGMSVSNSVFVGYPIIAQVVGPVADISLALCLLVENLLVIPATLVLADSNEALPWHKALTASLKNLLKNPIFIAILAGFGFSATGLELPAVLDRTLQIGASAAGPVALFMIGGVLVGQKLAGVKLDLGAVVLGKLVLHPLAVLLAIWLLPPLEPALQSAAVLYACMPLPAIYPALAQRYKLDGFCATVLVIATVVSFVTLNTWIWGLERFAN
jgi:predicted permease